ncbi:flagellar biosynthesis protein FliQ [Parachitinimonas caeni]|uniref:Flagellar biosynthetic protein FliQ n=1 Tax=Parachitinimonas caeni TaxID=3031301 RepID=A0ABT7DYJ2_9NEIS|nr:flagellar biosynthesis protein FliQ [Parachitinimonas caeni]MDK2125111.1 flagellar biosynthesis protein FliQ [Parachitinimonas caeni]
MSSDLVIHLLAELLWNALAICGPLMLLTMLIGLLISVFQVVTQVQDMSLSFVPKLLVTVVTLVVAGPWMLRKLVTYASHLIANIPNYI